MENQQELFKIEATELLQELEEALLELESRPDDQELIQRIFRCMHTIKGNGSMFGFDEISNFTHDIETVYDRIRNGEMCVDRKIIDLTLTACDQIKWMLDNQQNDPTVNQKSEEILRAFASLLPENPNEHEISVPDKNESAHTIHNSSQQSIIYLRFEPHDHLFKIGNNPVLLLNELREMGECAIVAHHQKLPDLEKMDPENCYVYWDILLQTASDLNAVRDVFIFVEDDSELYFSTLLESMPNTFTIVDHMKDLELYLSERGEISGYDLAGRLRKKIYRLTEKSPKSEPEKQEEPVTYADESGKETSFKNASSTQLVSSIRVSSDKLDALVDLAGELVIAKERLNQYVQQNSSPELIPIAEEIDRFTANLRDTAMSMRMLPIGTLLGKFKRLVRDLATEQGKEVEFITSGGETELDKTVLEKLNDPLIHLIRNAIDHGIEPSSIRMINGKSRTSHVTLKAFQSGSDVMVQIADDGKGIDESVIRKKAIEKGLISESTEISQKELFEIIFQPGFSTAQKVTEVSGRGVGMDVVRKKIEELRGSISIHSEMNKGTTFTLRLPLTLGIIEGLLVRIESDSFVLPLSAIEECLEIHRNDRSEKAQQIVNLRDEAVPYLRLRDLFEFEGEQPSVEQMLITKINDTRVGFVVDEIVGEHQIVIKSLGKMLKNIDGLSGAAILGDGTVALILDTPKLLEIAQKEKEARHLAEAEK